MHINLDLIYSLKAIFLICLANHRVRCIETPEPAGLLRPRNINPHPYTNYLDGANAVEKNIAENQFKYIKNIYDQGPVQFPPTNVNSANAIPHPYEKIALKERTGKLQRFGGEDKQVLPQAYQALARHAKKVLRKPVTSQKPTFFNYQDRSDIQYAAQSNTKNYAFSYSVQDKVSGDDFSHQQQQSNAGVNGQYQVALPDGRIQIVKYIADDDGYRADVTYNEETVAPPHTPQRQPLPHQPLVQQYYDPHSKPIHEDQDDISPHTPAPAAIPGAGLHPTYQQFQHPVTRKTQPVPQAPQHQSIYVYDDYPEYYQNLSPTPTPFYSHNVEVKLQDGGHRFAATTPLPHYHGTASPTPSIFVPQIQHPSHSYDILYSDYGYTAVRQRRRAKK